MQIIAPSQVYPVIVIGSGASGGMAAWNLTSKGIDVLVLDAGDRFELPFDLYPGVAVDCDFFNQQSAISNQQSTIPLFRSSLLLVLFNDTPERIPFGALEAIRPLGVDTVDDDFVLAVVLNRSSRQNDRRGTPHTERT
jgi:choline dehydrogenase-like flavoprotein